MKKTFFFNIFACYTFVVRVLTKILLTTFLGTENKTAILNSRETQDGQRGRSPGVTGQRKTQKREVVKMMKRQAIGMNRHYGKASSYPRMPTGASAAENIGKDIKKWKSIKCLRANRQVSKIDCIKHILLGDDPICFRDAPCSLGRVFVEKNEKKSYLGFCAECGKSVVQEDGSDGKLYSKYFLCRECFIRLLDHELVYEKEETKEND